MGFEIEGYLLLLAFTNHNTSVTPTELVHAPERIDREEERVDGVREDVDHHPTDKHKLALDDEDDRLQGSSGVSRAPTREERDERTWRPYTILNMIIAILGNADALVATTTIK